MNKLSEAELRAYHKCTEYGLHFKGKDELSLVQQLVRDCYITVITQFLKNEYAEKDLAAITVDSINKMLFKLELHKRLLDPELTSLRNKILLHLNDVYKKLPLNKFIPVYSNYPLNLKVKKTLLELEVPATLSLQDTSIHIVDFLPYSKAHTVELDLPTICKLQYFKENFVKVPKPKRFRAHIFCITDEGLNYYCFSDKDVTKKSINILNTVVTQYENRIHYPIYNCNNHCVFKNRCSTTEK